MIRNRNIKVVATLGPASSSYETIRALKTEGADVFRLNMSHGRHDDIARLHATIRKVEADMNAPICILADLQGPKLRCGLFEGGGALLVDGQSFRFDLEGTAGNQNRVQLPHPEIFRALTPGATLLVNDGLIRMSVIDCSDQHAECRVMVGGRISDRKGVNVPDVVLPLAALSDKDRADLEFVCELGVEWLALSFVQRPEDIEDARKLAKGRARILSKIEKPAAVNCFPAILDASDAIMVARGDLGVELPIQKVPAIQKQLVRGCRAAGKPVIVATQMLESMTGSPVPTRAEVSDVASAIYDGADAVMLSAESAAGQFPVDAVQMMNAIAEETEQDPGYLEAIEAARTPCKSTVSEAITSAAREIAETTALKTICCYTMSGSTATLAARERPRVPILALTPDPSVARRLGLVWGLSCAPVDPAIRFKGAVKAAVCAARDMGLAGQDDRIAVTAGIPFNTAGTTNILRVVSMSESLDAQSEAAF
ncbi:pyruvate kinase [Ruegeria sp. HKCCA5491]|uniref:pyruvate kinase n=1 Tax=Ruegeria sp. HKCCA5491 TaxID=2682986 RepID=UPI001489901D|nr:pyruvate kinase [Ruegeria sp. HKCCA5491]